MSDISIKEIDGFDVVQYQPKGVCSRMMQFRIKDEISVSNEVFFTTYRHKLDTIHNLRQIHLHRIFNCFRQVDDILFFFHVFCAIRAGIEYNKEGQIIWNLLHCIIILDVKYYHSHDWHHLNDFILLDLFF